MRRAVALAAVFGVLLAAVVAQARSKEGVTMPDELVIGGKKVVLNGMGLREATAFDVDVYVAGLYVETKSSDPKAILDTDQARRIVLHFVRDVEKDSITDAWTEGFRKCGVSGSFGPKIAKLNGWMADMEEGQALVFNYIPGEGLQVTVDGRKKGVIDGADFAKAFFAIFIGPNPPNPGLKTGLLGK